ncbi:MAG: ATP-binding protein [Flavobacteriales bacterium]
MPRSVLFLLLSLLFSGLALLVHEPDGDERLDDEARRMERAVDAHAQHLQAMCKEQLLSLSKLGGGAWMRANSRWTSPGDKHKGITFIGLQGDSLICWSGEVLWDIGELHGYTAAHLMNGEAVSLHAVSRSGDLEMHAVSPVWLAPPIENHYLERGFHPSMKASKGLRAESGAGLGPVVRDAQGQVMFRLSWRDGAMEVGDWIRLRFALMIMATAFLIATMWSVCAGLARRNAWGGIFLFLGGLLVLRAATLAWGPLAPFDRLPLFDPAVYAASLLFPSLGDLLFNAVLLLLGGLFVRQALHAVHSDRQRWPGNMLAWSVVLLHAAWITRLFIGLVNDSSVELDLYRVQEMSAFSLIALLSVALLFTAWVVLAHTLMRLMLAGANLRSVMVTGALALVGSIVIHHILGIVDTLLFLWPVPLIALLVLAHRGRSGFAGLLLGLGVLAGLSTHVLTKYMRNREQRERVVLAERLAVREDPVLEQLFRETAPGLRADTAVYHLLVGPAPCDPGLLEERVRLPYFSGYWERYDVRLYAFGPQGVLRCANDPDPPRSLNDTLAGFSDPLAVADMPDLFIEERPGEGSFYHARVAVMPVDSLPPGQLIVELQPRSLSQSLGFPELLLAGGDPVDHRADRYAQARYQHGVLMERSKGPAQPQHWTRPLDSDGTAWYKADGYEWLARGDRDGTLLVLGLRDPGLLDKATTFSYLFALFSVLATIVFASRAIWKARGIPSLSLGAKVRIALVLFAVTGLLFFGFGTERLLSQQYTQRSNETISEKARFVHQELQRRLSGEPVLNSGHVAYLEHLLGQLSNVFFTDITVYAVDGRMLATSRPQIFSAGLLGRWMDPVAYERLALSGMSSALLEGSIGTAPYRTAYLPLTDRKGTVLAFIALPSFADQAQQEEGRSGVLVAVVNLFVLLFALSVLVAVFISNWTTRPLDLLKNALSRVGLQGANEPIRYQGDDEVGQLVEVYNRKVEELRDSAEKLARSERESAWREMARQVAHEIKNPLTPMKLSIQHFQRTWSPDEPDAAERLERFSQGMVQQIDALSAIAGEFSNFAQMPKAREERLDLAELAHVATEVFHSTPGTNVSVTSPSGPLNVVADREQLLRVFNNLLKNALQSIPDQQHGRIDILLRSEGTNAIAEVRDNGTGIAEADLERIFQPNFTTKSSGMGLGLAMVQRIVESAGGRVWFTTRSGEGTTFFVSLPLAG